MKNRLREKYKNGEVAIGTFFSMGIPAKFDALKFLNEERKVAAIGHEPADTDPAFVANSEGWLAERYWLGANKFQIELLANLDRCPETGALIFCTFPRVKGGSGFSARPIALVPKK